MPDLSAYQNLDDGTSISVFALNEGEWGNDLSIKFHSFTDAYYTLDVYQSQGTLKSLVESWIVSHRYALDVYGNQLFAEDRINENSDYILVAVNQHDDAPEQPLHRITNETVVTSGIVSKLDNTEGFEIIPSTVRVTVNTPGSFLIIDDGQGNLSGIGGTGTIDYKTGVYTFTFSAGSSGQIDYQYTSFLSLSGGVNGSSPTPDDYIDSLSKFSDKRDIDFEFFVEPEFTSIEFQRALCSMLEERKDAIAFLNTPSGLTNAELITWMQTTAVKSFCAVYCGPQILSRDNETGQVVALPAAPSVCNAYITTTVSNGPSVPVAGFETGGIKCIGTEKEFTDTELELLLAAQYNPIVPHYVDGAVLLEQRTTEASQGVKSHVHVVRLISFVLRVVVPYLRTIIGRNNNQGVWRDVSQHIESIFAKIQQYGGLKAYDVVCDLSNNVPEDENLYVDLVIVPDDFATKIVIHLKANDDVEFTIVN